MTGYREATNSGFLNPDKDCRPLVFWAINWDLKVAEIGRQIKGFAEAGFGGVIFHAREGLLTRYLSEEWFKMAKAAADYCSKNDMVCWIYDDDRWPSGYAGGRVAAENSDLRPRILIRKEFERKKDALRFFRSVKHPVRFDSYDNIWITFSLEVYSGEERRYNGSSPINYLDGKATDCFIASTHERYLRDLRKHAGNVIPGFFTDEPASGGFSSKGIPWTEGLPDRFRHLNGYSIREHLVDLFYETKDSLKIRYDFWRTFSLLLGENYVGRIDRWCRKNKMALTGHFNGEDDFVTQIWTSGAMMVLYSEMRMPGVDLLGKSVTDGIAIRQVVSSAKQYGRRKVLCEYGGASGQEQSFADHKKLVDFQAVLGVNVFCPHLSLYALPGVRKRDYPPTLSEHQPWWPENKFMQDYTTRLNYALSRGISLTKILVLHTITSAWAIYDFSKPTGEQRGVQRLYQQFKNLSRELTKRQREFDYGFEADFEKKGFAKATDFVIGKMHYKVVIIPPCHTLTGKTVDLLELFSENGGQVICLEPKPTLVDCAQGDAGRLGRLFANCHVVDSEKTMITVLEEVLPPDITVVDRNGKMIPDVIVRTKEGRKQASYFIVNLSGREITGAEVRMPGTGCVERWNAEDGSIQEVDALSRGNTIVYHTPILKDQSILLMRRETPRIRSGVHPSTVEKHSSILKGWKVRPTGPNVLVIDQALAGWRGHTPKKPEYVLDIQTRLEKTRCVSNLSLTYSFECDFSSGAPEDLALIVERPDLWKVSVNGRKVPPAKTKEGGVFGLGFGSVNISKYVNPGGRNYVALSGGFISPTKDGTYIYRKNGTEIESIYVSGAFKVRGNYWRPNVGQDFKDTSPPIFVHSFSGKFLRHHSRTNFVCGDGFVLTDVSGCEPGDVVTQGWPFYAGRISYQAQFFLASAPAAVERLFLSLSGMEAAAAAVRLNGVECGVIAWEPYRCEVTAQAVPGINTVEVNLAGSLRNLFGPHHNSDGFQPAFTYPDSFKRREGSPDYYQFLKFGMTGGVSLEKERCHAQ